MEQPSTLQEVDTKKNIVVSRRSSSELCSVSGQREWVPFWRFLSSAISSILCMRNRTRMSGLPSAEWMLFPIYRSRY